MNIDYFDEKIENYKHKLALTNNRKKMYEEVLKHYPDALASENSRNRTFWIKSNNIPKDKAYIREGQNCLYAYHKHKVDEIDVYSDFPRFYGLKDYLIVDIDYNYEYYARAEIKVFDYTKFLPKNKILKAKAFSIKYINNLIDEIQNRNKKHGFNTKISLNKDSFDYDTYETLLIFR